MDRNSAKPGTPAVMPSKTIIANWLRSLFPDLPANLKIEDFGDGVIYCRILNHYCGQPAIQKFSWHPKNEYAYANNLKQVQAILQQQGFVLPFDVNKVSKRKFLENWQLINGFYKHFNEPNPNNNVNDENSVSSHGHPASQSLSSGLNRRNSLHSPGHQTELEQQRGSLQRHPSFQYQPPTQFLNPQQSQQIAQTAQSSLHMTSYLKENYNLYNSSPAKGKWSVGSQMLQSNQSAIIDRVKQILLKGSHDTQKIRQIKMLLGIPLEEEEVIKIEDDEINQIVYPQLDSQIVYPQLGSGVKESCSKQARESCVKQVKESCSKDGNKCSVSKSGKKPFKI